MWSNPNLSNLSIEVRPGDSNKAGAASGAAGQPGLSVGMKFLIVALLFIGSIMLGNYLSKSFRLPDQSLKFSVIVFSVVASLAVCYFEWPPKLGIDLSGGVILVYGINESQLETGQKPDMDKLVAAITKRVNPGGVREVTVRPYGLHEVEIIIPRATTDELDMIKGIIATSGALEFRITANIHDHADIIARAMETKDSKVIIDGEQKARWVPVEENETSSIRNNPDYITRLGSRGQLEALIITLGEPVTGQYLRNATATYDQTGRPCVTFAFDSRGSQLFGALTTANLPDTTQGFKRHLAIILDGKLITAPSINSAIYDRGEITGNFKTEDTTQLAAVLTAGQLPAVLHREPSTQMLTGPTLGADTIRKGVEFDGYFDHRGGHLHGVLLPFRRRRGQSGGGAQRAVDPGLHDPVSRGVHALRPGRFGPDGRHGRRRQRVDLRAYARRVGAEPRCVWPSATASTGPRSPLSMPTSRRSSRPWCSTPSEPTRSKVSR